MDSLILKKIKKTIFIILLVIPFRIIAQDFAPIGAIWHNSQSSWIIPDIITYKTIESVSDTTIDIKQCKKLIEVERLYSDTVFTFNHYLYSENDSVFFFNDNEFHLLYDFGAVAGDTLVLDYYLTFDGSPLLMIIDSTGTIDINGVERRIQYITCGDGVMIEFGGPVIEGIGSTYFLFPIYDGTVNGPLRCYQDDITGLYINYFYSNEGWNYEDCEQIITDIEEDEPISLIEAYPNPSSNSILIKNADPSSEFRITDINGNLIKKGQLGSSNEIYVGNLAHGIYLIELRIENQMTFKKIVKN